MQPLFTWRTTQIFFDFTGNMLGLEEYASSQPPEPSIVLGYKTLSAETSPYRCTWKTGCDLSYDVHGEIVPLDLRGIIIFLGDKFTRPYSRHQSGIMTSRFIRMPPPLSEPRQMKWVTLSNNTVVHRVCCHPEWTGYFCYTCNHRH